MDRPSPAAEALIRLLLELWERQKGDQKGEGNPERINRS